MSFNRSEFGQQLATPLPLITTLVTADPRCVSCDGPGLRQLAADDCFWAGLAEAKWGECVKDLKAKSEQQQPAEQTPELDTKTDAAKHGQTAAGSWQHYCYKRMSARTIRYNSMGGWPTR